MAARAINPRAVSIFEACLARTARCARLSRASSFARVRVARVYDIHARLFFIIFFLAHSRCVLSFSFVPLLIWCSKREIFNKNFPFCGNGRRAENECTRRRAKERRVLSCSQYVWARVRDDKFKKTTRAKKVSRESVRTPLARDFRLLSLSV